MSRLINFGEMEALALHLLADLAALRRADPLGRRGVGELAESLRASVHTLRKVARRLAVLGWIEGSRGVGGGFRLTADPARLRLLDVLRGMEGPVCVPGCLFAKRVCPAHARCVFDGLTGTLERQVLDYFRNTTLADLADNLAQPGDTKGDDHDQVSGTENH